VDVVADSFEPDTANDELAVSLSLFALHGDDSIRRIGVRSTRRR
jgi:hypothetical protein